MGDSRHSTTEIERARVILHVDMDAFYASVEQRDRPSLKGKPVIVGAGPNERGVVAAASYEARTYGVHSAMPSREAGRLCPHGLFVPPDMARYEKASRHVFRVFERYTPLIEPLSIDEAFLDVSGARRLFGDGAAIARQIRAAIAQEIRLTASVGVASNKFLAKVASDMNKPDGLTIVPTDPAGIRAFLAPLPVERLWGVGEVTHASLLKSGIKTIGDVQVASVDVLSRHVGRDGAAHFKLLALGIDDREVITDWQEKSMSREHTFSEDCRNVDEVRTILLELVDDVGRQLRSAGKYADVVQVKLRWKGFETITRQRTLDTPLFDDLSLRQRALEIFEAIQITRPVRLVGFGASRLVDKRSDQLSLFASDTEQAARRERLSHALDGIRKAHGDHSIGRPRR